MRLLLRSVALNGLCCLFLAAPARSAEGIPVAPFDLASFEFRAESDRQARAEVVAVADQTFATAWRVEVTEQPANPWKVQLATRSLSPVQRDDTLWVKFFFRCLASREESGEGRLTVVFETAAGNHEKSIDLTVGAGKEWKEFAFPFVCRHDLAAGEAQIAFRAGFRPQTVEIGGIELRNFGKEKKVADLPRTRADYPGRAADAPWRAAAEARIEKLRKGDYRVRILDEAGHARAGEKFAYRLRRHDFGFGTAVDSSVLLRETGDGKRYREIIDTYFSRVVYENELKWHTWERHGPEEHARTLRSFDWFAERGIRMRGHVLVWPSWQYLPPTLRPLGDDPSALRARVERHVREMTARTRGRFAEWDVINEPYAHHDLMRILGDEVMVDWFKAAHEVDPQARLFLNDYAGLANEGLNTPHKDHFEKTARFLMAKGAPIGGIGLQCHFGWSVTPPEAALRELDRWENLGLEVQITEFDVESTDEELQADYTRDLLTAAFSHPSVTAVMIWGFWEGRHWKPDAALWRRDWSIKPNGRVWTRLTGEHWHTAGEAITDADGWISFRGFHGRYEITPAGGKGDPPATVNLVPSSPLAECRFKFPD